MPVVSMSYNLSKEVIKAIIDHRACIGLATLIAKQSKRKERFLSFFNIGGNMEKTASSFKENLSKTYIYEIGKKNRKIVLSISLNSSNFFHLTGMHHISYLKVRPQVFYNRCLKGSYNKKSLLIYFSSKKRSFFSDREYHEFRLEVVERLHHVLSNPGDFVFKKINKQTYYQTGSDINFSYCIEKVLTSSTGKKYKAIIYLKFIEEVNNVEVLRLQSIGIFKEDYDIYQLSPWKILNYKTLSET